MVSKKSLALILSLTLLASASMIKPVKAATDLDSLYANAYKATVTAVTTKTQKAVNEARQAIGLLPKDMGWARGEFSKQVDRVQQPIFKKAFSTIALAQKTVTQANINAAKAAIDPDMPQYYRGSYSSAVDKIQQAYMKMAVEAFKKATQSKLQSDIDAANAIFSDIKTSNNSEVAKWVDLVQGLGDTKDLNDGGIHSASYALYSDTGIFGSANTAKPTTVKGNVTVNNANGKSMTLQNLNIEGILWVNFGAGDVVLNNVKVNGVTVANVGSNSLHVAGNSIISNLTVKDSNNDARIVVEGNATVANADVLSGGKLEVASSAVNTKPFGVVVIAPVAAPSDTNAVKLSGTFDRITVATSANVSLSASSKVTSSIQINAPATLSVESGANVAKVSISTSKPEDKVVLSGNLGNVDISKAATLEVKSGTVNISSSTNAVVNIKTEGTATVNKGQGTGNVIVNSSTQTAPSTGTTPVYTPPASTPSDDTTPTPGSNPTPVNNQPNISAYSWQILKSLDLGGGPSVSSLTISKPQGVSDSVNYYQLKFADGTSIGTRTSLGQAVRILSVLMDSNGSLSDFKVVFYDNNSTSTPTAEGNLTGSCSSGVGSGSFSQ